MARRPAFHGAVGDPLQSAELRVEALQFVAGLGEDGFGEPGEEFLRTGRGDVSLMGDLFQVGRKGALVTAIGAPFMLPLVFARELFVIQYAGSGDVHNLEIESRAGCHRSLGGDDCRLDLENKRVYFPDFNYVWLPYGLQDPTAEGYDTIEEYIQEENIDLQQHD